MTWERIRELRQLADLTEEENSELYDLSNKRVFEAISRIPLPTCCEAAQKFPVVIFSVDPGDCDSNTVDGHWRIDVNKISDDLRYRSPDRWKGNSEIAPRPNFCPYCSKALPKMVRKKEALPHVCHIIDGYYCNTCGERLQFCYCDPPEFAFEQEHEIPVEVRWEVKAVRSQGYLIGEVMATDLDSAYKAAIEKYGLGIDLDSLHVRPGI
jgi:hypothetical protein